MFKKVFFKVSMLSICLSALTVQAQESTQSNENKFGGIDAIINSLGVDGNINEDRKNKAEPANMVMKAPPLKIVPEQKKKLRRRKW